MSIAAGMLGLAVAKALLAVGSHLPLPFEWNAAPLLDLPVLTFAVLVSVMCGTSAAAIPATIATSENLMNPLRAGKQLVGGHHRSLFRPLLLASQIGLAVALLVTAGLLVRTIWTLTSLDLGFDHRSVLTARIALSPAVYQTPERQTYFVDELLARLQRLPAIVSVAAADALPLQGLAMTVPTIVEGNQSSSSQAPQIALSSVTADYFATMRIPLLSGRSFEASDTAESAPVVIVNDAFRRTMLHGRDPVGLRLRVGNKPSQWLTIVGVVGSVRQVGLQREPVPQIYRPMRQSPMGSAAVVMRTSGDAMRVAALLRKEVFALDVNQPVEQIMTMEQLVSQSYAPKHAVMILLTVLAALAVILAASGVYGLTAQGVRQRRREMAIRVALGAQQADVLRLVARQAHVVSLVGIGLGVGGAAVAGGLVSSLLFGVSRWDPATYIAASCIMAAAAALGTYVPARRALAQNAALILRVE